jgi:hypothetical protein
MIRVGPTFKQAGIDQGGQPGTQHGPRRVEVRGEIVEPANAVEGVPHDQQRPALTYYLKRACQRAILTFVSTGQHTAMQPQKAPWVQ